MNGSKLKGVESANVLQKEEMRLITGGKEEPKFHCTCTGRRYNRYKRCILNTRMLEFMLIL